MYKQEQICCLLFSPTCMKPLLLLFLFLSQTALATHLLGGYIQVKRIPTTSQQFTINVILFIDGTDSQFSSLPVCFGDGSSGTAQRVEQTIADSGLRVSRVVYSANHIYAGAGTYAALCLINNRTDGLRNIPTATGTPLGLSTTFSTSASNNTPVLPNKSLFRTNTFQKTNFAFDAVDAEGDSLTYFLSRPQTGAISTGCTTQLGPVSAYSFPNDVSRRGTFKINARSGELIWDAPAEVGTFSFAITVQERRNGVVLSQTQYEQVVSVVDQPVGTPGTVPPYEPAQSGSEGLITGVIGPEDNYDVLLTVYPVPASDRFRVSLILQRPSPVRLRLLDMIGRVVREAYQESPGQRYEQSFDVHELPTGPYMIQALVGGQTVTRKVMKR